MAHEHRHGDHHGRGQLGVAFALNLAFTVVEFAGAAWTNSVAIASDAVHDLGDSLSLGLAWYFQRFSQGEGTPRDSYGRRRYALLGGLMSAVVLMAGLAFVLWHAVDRLMAPQPVNAPGMMALAVLGILFNGAAVLRVRKGSSLTERVVSWHLLEDTLGWAAVLLGALAMTWWDLPWLDPLLSLGIAVFVGLNVVRNLRAFFDVFLQKAPTGFDRDGFERRLLSLRGVRSCHHLHSWSLDGERHVLTTHVVMAAESPREDVLAVKRAIRSWLDPNAFEHVTVDVELEGESCVAQPPLRQRDAPEPDVARTRVTTLEADHLKGHSA